MDGRVVKLRREGFSVLSDINTTVLHGPTFTILPYGPSFGLPDGKFIFEVK